MSAKNLTVEGLSPKYYENEIIILEAAVDQHESVARGEHQPDCALCGDTDHTADSCWFFNPALLAELGRLALTGEFWRCFHCGAVYTTEESAREHFGTDVSGASACIRELAQVEIRRCVENVPAFDVLVSGGMRESPTGQWVAIHDVLRAIRDRISVVAAS